MTTKEALGNHREGSYDTALTKERFFYEIRKELVRTMETISFWKSKFLMKKWQEIVR